MTPPEVSLLGKRAWQAVDLDEPRDIETIPTPALLLDEALLSANVERMASFLAQRGKAPRPHAKTHKCPLISRLQIAAGAVGICVAKASEALVHAQGEVGDILITSPVVDPARVPLLAEANRLCADLKIVVDSDAGLDTARAAAAASERTLGVVLDIDVEMGRTGSRDPTTLLRLAEACEAAPELALRGAQHYAGHLMHVAPYTERRERSHASWGAALDIIETIRAQGHSLDIVTGAGTGTFDIDSELDALTDLQVGSYIFMDEEYLAIEPAPDAKAGHFATSLTILASVISEPVSGLVTLDCGYKAMASETVVPGVSELPDARFRFAGDEHAVLILKRGSQQPLLGTRLQLVTPHCDPTVNLYDYYWVHRDGVAHSLWPIAARGCSW
ncbi:MAG: DSD1 family PLP-dependent enzyme [Pseudomonadota bacterium]